jgi:hypothetical protein
MTRLHHTPVIAIRGNEEVLNDGQNHEGVRNGKLSP